MFPWQLPVSNFYSKIDRQGLDRATSLSPGRNKMPLPSVFLTSDLLAFSYWTLLSCDHQGTKEVSWLNQSCHHCYHICNVTSLKEKACFFGARNSCIYKGEKDLPLWWLNERKLHNYKYFKLSIGEHPSFF